MTDSKSRRGGARPGAGRKPRKSAAARGITPATAAEILERKGERSIWYRLLDSPDDSIVLRAMVYLTDRRDGRPAQQVNITSRTLTLTPSDLEKARAVVRELRGDLPALVRDSALTPVQEGDPKGLIPDGLAIEFKPESNE